VPGFSEEAGKSVVCSQDKVRCRFAWIADRVFDAISNQQTLTHLDRVPLRRFVHEKHLKASFKNVKAFGVNVTVQRDQFPRRHAGPKENSVSGQCAHSRYHFEASADHVDYSANFDFFSHEHSPSFPLPERRTYPPRNGGEDLRVTTLSISRRNRCTSNGGFVNLPFGQATPASVGLVEVIERSDGKIGIGVVGKDDPLNGFEIAR
jgi:hypothetical protein